MIIAAIEWATTRRLQGVGWRRKESRLARHTIDALHRQLKTRAAMAGLSLSDFLLREARKIAEQPTPEEMAERLRQREPYRGKVSPTQVLREERDAR